MPNSVRILLIDDHVLVREGIARMLAAQPDLHVAGQAGTIEEAIGIIRKTAIDVVLLDVNLGSSRAGSFVSRARAAGFHGKVLVVTGGLSTTEAANLLGTGCSGIFLKHQPPRQLIERIRELAHGTEAPGPPTPEALEEYEAVSPPTLTPRERKVLPGVFAGRPNKEIAYGLGVSEPLVKRVVHDLFTKTGARSRSQSVRVALERYWRELE